LRELDDATLNYIKPRSTQKAGVENLTNSLLLLAMN
jgi:hypothetical protein